MYWKIDIEDIKTHLDRIVAFIKKKQTFFQSPIIPKNNAGLQEWLQDNPSDAPLIWQYLPVEDIVANRWPHTLGWYNPEDPPKNIFTWACKTLAEQQQEPPGKQNKNLIDISKQILATQVWNKERIVIALDYIFSVTYSNNTLPLICVHLKKAFPMEEWKEAFHEKIAKKDSLKINSKIRWWIKSAPKSLDTLLKIATSSNNSNWDYWDYWNNDDIALLQKEHSQCAKLFDSLPPLSHVFYIGNPIPWEEWLKSSAMHRYYTFPIRKQTFSLKEVRQTLFPDNPEYDSDVLWKEKQYSKINHFKSSETDNQILVNRLKTAKDPEEEIKSVLENQIHLIVQVPQFIKLVEHTIINELFCGTILEKTPGFTDFIKQLQHYYSTDSEALFLLGEKVLKIIRGRNVLPAQGHMQDIVWEILLPGREEIIKNAIATPELLVAYPRLSEKIDLETDFDFWNYALCDKLIPMVPPHFWQNYTFIDIFLNKVEKGNLQMRASTIPQEVRDFFAYYNNSVEMVREQVEHLHLNSIKTSASNVVKVKRL